MVGSVLAANVIQSAHHINRFCIHKFNQPWIDLSIAFQSPVLITAYPLLVLHMLFLTQLLHLHDFSYHPMLVIFHSISLTPVFTHSLFSRLLLLFLLGSILNTSLSDPVVHLINHPAQSVSLLNQPFLYPLPLLQPQLPLSFKLYYQFLN